MERVVGIDIGSSSVKAGLFAMDGAAAALSVCEYGAADNARPYAERNPEEWWQAAVCCIRKTCLHDPGRIAGIAITGHISSLTFLDVGGRPLRAAIGFRDARAAAETREMLARFSREELASFLGIDLPPSATWPLPRLMWLRKHEPDVLERAHCVLQAKDYVNYRLTGALASDVSSNRGLVNVQTQDVPSRLFRAFDLPEALVPAMRAPEEIVGTVSRAAAAETGLPEGVPVAAGWNDLNAAVLGSGVVDAGQAFNITGTSEHIGVVVGDGVLGDDAAAPAELVLAPFLPGSRLLYGATVSGGGSLEWYRNAFRREYEDLIRQANLAAPGSDGLCFLPYLEGERAPIWDPDARRAFAGIRTGHREEHFVRAILEGVAFGLRHIQESIDPVAPAGAEPIAISGGAARIDAWNQIRADVLERRATIPANRHAGVLGAAMLAAVAAGRYASCRDAAKAMARPGRNFEPDRAHRETYRRAFARYRGLYPALRPWFAGNATAGSGGEDS